LRPHDPTVSAWHFRPDAVWASDGGQVWTLRLEGKTDQEKFKELGWGLRTWDQWYFNECLPREIFTPLNLSVSFV